MGALGHPHVYYQGVTGRLRDAILMDFPRSKRDKRFQALLDAFVEKLPSRRHGLAELSDDFISYLRGKDRKLAALARIELEKVKLRLSVEAHSPSTSLTEISPLRLSSNARFLEESAQLLFRQAGKIRAVSVSAEKALALRMLQRGTTLESLERSLQRRRVRPALASRWFKDWASRNLLSW